LVFDQFDFPIIGIRRWDEEEGSFSIKVNHDVKNKGPTTSFQAILIDLDSPPQT
jgi:hypothetical protein